MIDVLAVPQGASLSFLNTSPIPSNGNACTMDKRTESACDQCHGHKLKCSPQPQGCVRCMRLRIRCTSDRPIKKRGRKSIRKEIPRSPTVVSDALDYPVLDCLHDLSILKPDKEHARNSTIHLTRYEACRLLEHFFTSPNQEFHALLIRRERLLNQRAPRPTEPTLLLSLLCVACFMPSDESSALSESSSKERAALGRYLFDKMSHYFHPRTLPDANHVFDDALTAFIMTSISPSEQSVESSLHYWLAFLKSIVQELQLYKNSPTLSEDDREERRRLWWASYIIDRHVALSFNERPHIPDQECQLLPTPSPDSVWVLPGPLLRSPEINFQGTMLGYGVKSLDMLGIYIPLSKILGEILEHRFLREHPTFNKNEKFLAEIKSNILQNLEKWFNSFIGLAGQDFYTIADPMCTLPPPPNIPKVAYYGLHMYHCMFVLLHGPMDIVRMYKDHAWQSSSDFITAGEHAVACANVARYILQVDPRLCLMYRFFGTYFLQSSFIFLILARKLGRQSDELIMRNCAINLQVLDKFVATTNMDYQHTFAKFIRRALSYNMGQPSSEDDINLDNPLAESLDPESLPYRWIPGYRGLQVGPMSKE